MRQRDVIIAGATLLLAWGLFTLPSCKGGGTSCADDSDCFRGESCIDGTCGTPQSGDANAPSDGEAGDTDRAGLDSAVSDSSGDRDSTGQAVDGCLTEEMRCDGKDDDCDGETDEDLTKTCPKTEGVCENAEAACEKGGFESCTDLYGNDYEETESKDDGLDNDCDGRVDNVPTVYLYGTRGNDSNRLNVLSFEESSGLIYALYAGCDEIQRGAPPCTRIQRFEPSGAARLFNLSGTMKPAIVLTSDAYFRGGLIRQNGNIYVGYTPNDPRNDTRGDARLAKLDKNGSRYWVEAIDDTKDDVRTLDVAVDTNNGRIYAAGGNDTTASGPGHGFLHAYPDRNNNQKPDWEKKTTSVVKNEAVEVESDSGHIFTVGSDNGDVFLDRRNLKGEGVANWPVIIGKSSGRQTGTDLAIDHKRDRIYVVGSTVRTFGGESFAGKHDGYIAAIGMDGKRKWLRIVGTPDADTFVAVDVRQRDGAIFVTGRTTGSLGGAKKESNGDAFIARYSPDGNQKHLEVRGDPGASDRGNDVVADEETDDVYVTGQTEGNFGCESCNTIGKRDLFMWRVRLP